MGQASTSKDQGRVYTLTPQDAQASNVVITSTLLVSSLHVILLLDLGATHSFISPYFATFIGRDTELVEFTYFYSHSVGDPV